MLQRLSLVLLLAIAAVVAAALALGAYLNYGSVRAAYMGQVESRMNATGTAMVHDAETSISFGIPLEGQETLGPLLERILETDPALEILDVLNSSGVILHSSDPERIGETLDLFDDEGLQLNLAIANDFGGEAGSLRLIADQALLERNLEATAAAVRDAALYALFVALALAVLAVLALLSGARRHAQDAGQLASGAQDSGQGWALAEITKEQAAIEAALEAQETAAAAKASPSV
ncbi:MAG: hypothetical protein AAFY02_20305 [Pseudomonadota bacterium]